MSESASVNSSLSDLSDPVMSVSPSLDASSSQGTDQQPDVAYSAASAGAIALDETPHGDASSFDASSFSVETYANQLMDELFGDIERGLEPGGRLLVEPQKPSVSERSPNHPPTEAIPDLAVPHLAMASMIAAPSDGSIEAVPPDSSHLDPLAAELDALLTPLEADPAPAARPSSSLDKVLLALSFVSLLLTAGIWVFLKVSGQDGMSLFRTGSLAPETSVAVQSQPQTAGEGPFLNYLNHALDAIQRRSQTVASAPTTELPAAAVNGSTTTPNSAPSAIERVYIPVYQPPATLPAPVAAAPVTVAPAATIVPGTTVAPTGAPSPAPVTTADVPNIAPPTTPHVLVGLLEQGDRSVALFEVNGAIQRVHIGEGIGSSGWALVSVSDSEAIVRRNGEVRSIYVGQRF